MSGEPHSIGECCGNLNVTTCLGDYTPRRYCGGGGGCIRGIRAGGSAPAAEALLRQALTKAVVTVPLKVDLELAKYVNNRGVKKLMFKAEHEIKDPLAAK